MSPPKSASVPRQRSPSSWSPRTKSAARTIKRIVTKKYTQKKYRSYTHSRYHNIRAGKAPTHFSAIQRRMRTHPVMVNVPLYRGVEAIFPLPKNFPTKEKILANGYFINKSFTSFSKSRNWARLFTERSPGSFPYILTLPPGRYPAINRQNFIKNRLESEITLAPGIYTVNKNRPLTNNGNIRVTYKPLR